MCLVPSIEAESRNTGGIKILELKCVFGGDFNETECIVLCLASDDWGHDSFIVRSLLLDTAHYTQLAAWYTLFGTGCLIHSTHYTLLTTLYLHPPYRGRGGVDQKWGSRGILERHFRWKVLSCGIVEVDCGIVNCGSFMRNCELWNCELWFFHVELWIVDWGSFMWNCGSTSEAIVHSRVLCNWGEVNAHSTDCIGIAYCILHSTLYWLQYLSLHWNSTLHAYYTAYSSAYSRMFQHRK